MDTISRIPVSLVAVSDFQDELQRIYEEVAQRAHQRFVERGYVEGYDLEDWFLAERDVIERPVSSIRQSNSDIIVNVQLPAMAPEQFTARVTPVEMLVTSNPGYEGRTILGVIRFPQIAEMDGIDAEFAEGILRVTMALKTEYDCRTKDAVA